MLEARETYVSAISELEGQRNSVVLAAGNEGEVLDFVRQWCQGGEPRLPENFEHNDFRHPILTVVGATSDGERASYTSREPEIDSWADGQFENVKGTSFAAPRVAARLAEIHGQNPHFSSEQAEEMLLRSTKANAGE